MGRFSHVLQAPGERNRGENINHFDPSTGSGDIQNTSIPFDERNLVLEVGPKNP